MSTTLFSSKFTDFFHGLITKIDKFISGAMGFADSVSPYVSFIACGVLIAMVVVLVAAAPKKMSSKEICYMAAAITMSYVLSYVKVSPVPNGGSITFCSYLPLVVFSYACGTKKGLLAGFIYSFLQIMQEPYAIGLFQVLLDYTIPFTIIGLAGSFRKIRSLRGYDVLIALTCIYFIRYCSHVASGVLYWSTPFAASLVYNASYIVLDFVLLSAATVVLLTTGAYKRLVRIINPKMFAPAAAAVNGSENAPQNGSDDAQ